ncbi:MAG TPA: hypothetical protein VNL38_00665 [Candidatus Nitrosotenuis sp.]|nr:hypothetical protein [Candidatus Nitrosotenuis sp.]
MSKTTKSQVDSAPTPRRKPYVKPACLSEQIFEATALACGKLPGGGGFCSSAPKAS